MPTAIIALHSYIHFLIFWVVLGHHEKAITAIIALVATYPCNSSSDGVYLAVMSARSPKTWAL